MSTTPNMGLVIPEPLVTTGPTYATQINEALDDVDAHDHSPGKGARITPSGLNINADVAFNQNSATNVKSIVLASQASVSTNATVYQNGGDLFFKRGDGTTVQITNSGGVNTSGVGGITGLGGTSASATYTNLSSTFGWFSDATTYAKNNTGDLTIFSRAGSVLSVQGVTLKADVTTTAYDLNLPVAAPAANTLMRFPASGSSKFVTLLGTNNQVTVTHNTSDMTLSLPQNIHTAATPTFAGMTLTGNIAGTTTNFSGAATVGSLISGAVQGTTGTFSSNLSCTGFTASGNISLTGGSGTTLIGTNVDATFLGITASVSTLGLASGTYFYAGALGVESVGGVKTNTIVPTSGTSISLNAGTVNVKGKIDGSAYSIDYIGHTITQAMGGNVNTSTAYQNLASYTLPAGIWEVSANVIFEWTSNQSTSAIQTIETAISLSSGIADSSTYYQAIAVPSSWKSSTSGMSLTSTPYKRIVNVSSPTTVYLVGRSDTYGGGTNGARFSSLGTLLVMTRVG